MTGPLRGTLRCMCLSVTYCRPIEEGGYLYPQVRVCPSDDVMRAPFLAVIRVPGRPSYCLITNVSPGESG